MKEKSKKDANNGHEGISDDTIPVSDRNAEGAVVKDSDRANTEKKISAKIGMRIKKARENHCLSLFDIYLRTDIGVELLSQIEAGKIIPSIGAVIKLAKALDLKMGYLISGEEKKAYTIVRQDDREVTSRYDSKREKQYGYKYESLAPHKTNRFMEPFLVTLEPSETDEERSTHDGQEFIFVLQGEMEVRIEDEIHILKPGDSIYYDSTVPHLVKCHGKEATQILAVLYTGK